MKVAPIADIKAKLSEYIEESHNGAVIITKNGRPTAAIVPIESDDDLERIVLSRSKLFSKIIKSSEKKIRTGTKVAHDKFWDDTLNPSKSKKETKKPRKKRNGG